jgi:hypothetical protein
MTLLLRIPNRLYQAVRIDLARPHAFAAERVGLAKARIGTGEGGDRIILFTGYDAVADDDYIDDAWSGARIDSNAIRKAMTTILQEDVGLFHVHLHDFPGTPALGRMDRREIPELIKTFRATGPHLAHGIFLLSADTFSSWVWLRGQSEPLTPDRSVVIGMPLFVRRTDDE